MHALAQRGEYSLHAETPSRPEPVARHIRLRLAAPQMRRAHHEIVTRLAAKGIRVSLESGDTQERLPAAVDLLLELERIIYRLRGPRPSDHQPLDERTSPRPAVDSRPDLVFDFSGGEAAPDGLHVIRPLFDGVPGETALLGALAAGRMPVIEMEDVAAGVIIARAAPRAENSATLVEGLDCALACLATLVTAVVGGVHPLAVV